MKSLLLSGILSFFILSCVSADNNTNENNNSKENNNGGVIYLDKETFKEKVFDFDNNKEWKYNGDTPAILDFYADWCGPCKMLAPVLDKIQKEYNGKVQVFKVNTDKEKELAGIFGIRSLPTIVFIPIEGKPQAVMGFRPQEQMEEMITKILKVTK